MRRESKVYGGKGNAGTFKKERLTYGCKCNEKNQFKCFKHTTKFIILLISAIFILSNANPILLGVNIKFLEQLEISQEGESLLKPKAFCITDDGIFIIPDYEAGNIKIYEKVVEDNKELLRKVKIVGRKGYGKDEFVRPGFCFYNKSENKFVVLDFGIKKIFIYDRIGRIDFKRVKEVSCWDGAYDIKLIDNWLFVSGYTTAPNERHYDFYYIDLTNNQTTYLLPSSDKFELSSTSPSDFETKYLKKHIPVVGIKGFFDIYRDDAFFVWEGNLKVIKINIESGELAPQPFGMRPPHYVKPYTTENMINWKREGEDNLIENEKAKMSYVKNIFVSSRYVMVIYQGSVNQGNALSFWMQFYTLDGDFINEVNISDQLDWRMWFDKDTQILYSFKEELSKKDGKFFILKYKIL
jgi:hypothetical protein